MKSEKNKEKFTVGKDKQQDNNFIAFISGIGAFTSFLTSVLFLINFTDQNFDCKSKDNSSSDKSSLMAAIFFKISTMIWLYIYAQETKYKSDNQFSTWNAIKDFFSETGEQALQSFIDDKLNIIGLDKIDEQ